MQPDVDGWMPKHFDDSLVDPLVTSAHSYAVARDFGPVTSGGLPSVFNGHGNRFIQYVYDDIDGVVPFIDGPDVRAAIKDGEEREGQYPPLDDEAFNGVVYTVDEVRGRLGLDVAGTGAIVVERFEVPEASAAAFDPWFGEHLDQWAAVDGVRRARTFRAYREMPRRFPHDRYLGKGNRMLLLELGDGVEPREVLARASVQAALARSVAWDLRLPYVRREVARHLVSRTRADLEEGTRG
jgi:hypothetical protein